jgi:hypothetical protein
MAPQPQAAEPDEFPGLGLHVAGGINVAADQALNVFKSRLDGFAAAAPDLGLHGRSCTFLRRLLLR